MVTGTVVMVLMMTVFLLVLVMVTLRRTELPVLFRMMVVTARGGGASGHGAGCD